MVPVRIALQGFLSYRDRAEIIFDGASLWMLSGRNGAGKSALFDGITFALYGFGRFGEKVVQDYISHDARDLWVEFDFDLGDRRYRVKRTASRTKPSTFQAFEVERASGQASPLPGIDNKKGLEDWVERTLGLDCQSFVAAVLLRQGNSERLLSADDTEREAIMRRIVDLSAYERLHEEVNNRARGLERDTDSLRKTVQRLEGEIEAAICGTIDRFRLCTDEYPLQEEWSDADSKLARNLEEIERSAGEDVTALSGRLLALTEANTIMAGWKNRVEGRAERLWKRSAYEMILIRV